MSWEHECYLTSFPKNSAQLKISLSPETWSFLLNKQPQNLVSQFIKSENMPGFLAISVALSSHISLFVIIMIIDIPKWKMVSDILLVFFF